MSVLVLLALGAAFAAVESRPARSGDEVYLYGPRSSILDETAREVCSGKGSTRRCEMPNVISLGWLDRVEVLAVRNGKVKFKRDIGAAHAANIGWAPSSSVLRREEFKYLKTWDHPGTFAFCERDDYCFRLKIEPDATFTWTQVSSKDQTCYFWLNNDWEPCTTHGYIYTARDILLFEGTDDFADFMKEVPGGLCRVRGKEDDWACESSSLSYETLKSSNN